MEPCTTWGPANMLERMNGSDKMAWNAPGLRPPPFFLLLPLHCYQHGAGMDPACREATVTLKLRLCLFRLSVLPAGGRTPSGVWFGTINCSAITLFLWFDLEKACGTALFPEVNPRVCARGSVHKHHRSCDRAVWCLHGYYCETPKQVRVREAPLTHSEKVVGSIPIYRSPVFELAGYVPGCVRFLRGRRFPSGWFAVAARPRLRRLLPVTFRSSRQMLSVPTYWRI